MEKGIADRRSGEQRVWGKRSVRKRVISCSREVNVAFGTRSSVRYPFGASSSVIPSRAGKKTERMEMFLLNVFSLRRVEESIEQQRLADARGSDNAELGSPRKWKKRYRVSLHRNYVAVIISRSARSLFFALRPLAVIANYARIWRAGIRSSRRRFVN